MQLAIFGISNDALNLAVNLIVLFLVVVWLALIYWTYADAKRRMEDPMLIACATGASLFPYLGSIVYTILRPPEFIEDAHERDLEIRAAELRVRQLTEQSCPHCSYPIEKSFLRCPNCRRRVKDPCANCSQPLDPRWGICPYCETEVARRQPPAAPQRPKRRAQPKQQGRKARPQAARGGRQQRAPQRTQQQQQEPQRPQRKSAPGEQPEQPPRQQSPPRQGGGSSRPATS